MKKMKPLGINFFRDLERFGEEKRGQDAFKIVSKSNLNSKSDFHKKPHFSFGKTINFKGLEVELGSKNRSKIDEKTMPR